MDQTSTILTNILATVRVPAALLSDAMPHLEKTPAYAHYGLQAFSPTLDDLKSFIVAHRVEFDTYAQSNWNSAFVASAYALLRSVITTVGDLELSRDTFMNLTTARLYSIGAYSLVEDTTADEKYVAFISAVALSIKFIHDEAANILVEDLKSRTALSP